MSTKVVFCFNITISVFFNHSIGFKEVQIYYDKVQIYLLTQKNQNIYLTIHNITDNICCSLC